MGTITFSEADEGKRVVNANGEKIGVIAQVHEETAYINTDPDVVYTIKSKLGWDDIDEDTHPLSRNDVSTVIDDEVRLSQF
jgi:hypothetical protein